MRRQFPARSLLSLSSNSSAYMYLRQIINNSYFIHDYARCRKLFPSYYCALFSFVVSKRARSARKTAKRRCRSHDSRHENLQRRDAVTTAPLLPMRRRSFAAPATGTTLRQARTNRRQHYSIGNGFCCRQMHARLNTYVVFPERQRTVRD